MKKVGRNDPCPCGSGKKYKKCCLPKNSQVRYTRQERDSALTRIHQYIERNFGRADKAFEEFWGEFLNHTDDLEDHQDGLSDHVYDLWYAFDRPMDDGRLFVDIFLEKKGSELSPGERDLLQTLRDSSMRLYEIEDALPGESLTLRDVIEGGYMTVRERLGSKSLNRHDWIAARVVSCGTSGRPEIEGLLPIPVFYRNGLCNKIRSMREDYLRENPGGSLNLFYKDMPPIFHRVWVGSIFDPYVPPLANTDGEGMVLTEVLFDILDRGALVAALRGAEGFTCDEEEGRGGEAAWQWCGKNVKGKNTLFGSIKLQKDTLRLETNSVARGKRGRSLIESVAGGAVCFRIATHEDMRKVLKESLRTGRKRLEPAQKDEIPAEIQEALTLDFMARHFRGWLEESIPALEGHTPREAARSNRLRPKLIDLLHEADRQYQYALKNGQPAFDASWVWNELGLEADAPEYPPLLAHERVNQLVPGSGEICRSVAETHRLRPDFEDKSSVITLEDLADNLEIQRILRRQGTEKAEHCDLAPYLERMINFELHRRKSFWVDASLAYMLAQTDIDVVGRELRVPFPSFAVIFTDRFVLSLAERMLARVEECPLAGQFIRVATVFVTERTSGEDRTLELCFALDSLGGDMPYLVTHRLPVQEEGRVESYLDAAAPLPPIEDVVSHANPLRGLLQVVINAILYATSAGVTPEVRLAGSGSASPRHRGMEPISYSSDEVYFLPGAIEISQVRHLEELGRISGGREILRRFMVRGHWRRPAANWKEQRMRWIRPYWKGPDMATIIERAYKLKP